MLERVIASLGVREEDTLPPRIVPYEFTDFSGNPVKPVEITFWQVDEFLEQTYWAH